MTLVISLISRDHAIQISDRKLVWIEPDESIREREGEFNKAVLYCKRIAFSYCGLAEVGPRRQRTDLWLADELMGLGEVDQGALIVGLAERATERFAHPRIAKLPPSSRRHAFAAVGWSRFEGNTEFEPYFALVSNFHGAVDGEFGEFSQAKGRFRWAAGHRLSDGDGRTFVMWVGAQLNDEEQADLTRLQGADTQGPDFANLAVELLVDAVRSVGNRLPTVGKGLLVNVLPRDSITAGESERIILAGGPTPGQQTFLYVPPGTNDGVVYGPTYACPDGALITNFEAWGL